MKFIKPLSLKKISDLLESEIIIKSEKKINYIYGISDFFSSSEKDVIIFNNPNFLKYLNFSKAGLVILKKKYEKYSDKNCIVTDNPRLCLSKLTKLCIKKKNYIRFHKINIYRKKFYNIKRL